MEGKEKKEKRKNEKEKERKKTSLFKQNVSVYAIFIGLLYRRTNGFQDFCMFWFKM